MTYEDLPGYFDFADLYDRMVAEAHTGDIFVEVGVWHGKSLAYLADAIQRSDKIIPLYGVDRFDEVSVAVVSDNLRQCGIRQQVTLVKEDSDRAARFFHDGHVAFCFIDADHSYDGVRRDIAAWRPKMKRGGTMAGHDRVRDGVHRAVVEAFGAYNLSDPLSWWVRV